MKISKDAHIVFVISTVIVAIISYMLGPINPVGFTFGLIINTIQLLYFIMLITDIIEID